MNEIKPTVTFEDFAKIDLRVGRIESAEEVPDSDKLIKLIIDIGSEKRQIIAGIKKWYGTADLVGKQIVICVNLAYRILAGLVSEGMLIAAHTEDGGAVILIPDKEVFNGSHLS